MEGTGYAKGGVVREGLWESVGLTTCVFINSSLIPATNIPQSKPYMAKPTRPRRHPPDEPYFKVTNGIGRYTRLTLLLLMSRSERWFYAKADGTFFNEKCPTDLSDGM